MRTLEFQIACQNQQQGNEQSTEQFVVTLLFKQLNQQGFDLTLPAYATNRITVGLNEKQLPIEVKCQQSSEEGVLDCAIRPQPNDDELDWFERIEAQSMIKQLAQAVENILNEQPSIQALTWKNGN